MLMACEKCVETNPCNVSVVSVGSILIEVWYDILSIWYDILGIYICCDMTCFPQKRGVSRATHCHGGGGSMISVVMRWREDYDASS